MKTKLLLGVFAIIGILALTNCGKKGCKTSTACNYDASVTEDDGTCITKGQVTFWNTSSPNIITVSISGQSNQTITSSSPATSCGGSGFANFTLCPGTYSFTATDGTSNWSGNNVAITDNGCLLYQLL